VLFSFLTYKQIPIANGEEFRYLRGKETLNHLLHGKFTETLIQPVPNYFLYNIYPAVLVYLNPSFYYEWFHLFNLLFSVIIFICVYIIVFSYSKNTFLALLSNFILILIPAFFGQIGFNPIDMPYTVFYLLSLLCIYYLRSNKIYSPLSILILGVLFGITQGLRQLGFTLYITLFIYDLYIYGFKNIFKLIKDNFFNYILVFIVANFVMLITWPNFAINYFKNLWWYLFVGSNFYLWDYGLLFNGEFLNNASRPWYYLPLLQTLTLPICIIVLFFIGVLYFKKLFANKLYFLVFISLFINYALYFILNPVVYDGTRHFLFMYPLIVILAIIHLDSLSFTIKKYSLWLLFIELSFLLLYLFKSFPYEYTYFNNISLLFGNPNYLFETDYSSINYRKISEWLRDVYSDSVIEKQLVYSCDNGYAVDYYSYKKFLTTIKREEADLIICDYKNILKNNYKGNIIKTFDLNEVEYFYVIKTNIIKN